MRPRRPPTVPTTVGRDRCGCGTRGGCGAAASPGRAVAGQPLRLRARDACFRGHETLVRGCQGRGAATARRRDEPRARAPIGGRWRTGLRYGAAAASKTKYDEGWPTIRDSASLESYRASRVAARPNARRKRASSALAARSAVANFAARGGDRVCIPLPIAALFVITSVSTRREAPGGFSGAIAGGLRLTQAFARRYHRGRTRDLSEPPAAVLH